VRPLHRTLAAALAVTLLVLVPAAHIRLQVNSGTPLYWGTPSNIGIVINSTGSDDITDGSHETAIRLAIRDWNGGTGTTAQLVEDTAPAQQARTDYASTNIHLVMFDESNASGYFSNPGTVAVTPVWFYGSGLIADADVLFNGLNHQFTTEVPGTPGRFDVGDVATHEIGHLLGLDHSGFAGATMYPYVDPIIILHRSPSLDDLHGLREAYPSGSSGRLTGTILRTSDSSPVHGACVFARDAFGHTSGATLTAANGSFSIVGLDAGIYDVGVSPLDGPVSAANLGIGHTIQTDFESAETPGSFALGTGQTLAVGTLNVDGDVTVSLGDPGDPFPLRCVMGLTNVFFASVHGSGLSLGSTLTTTDPFLTIHSVNWLGTRVDFSVDVGAGAEVGHADLKVVTATGDVNILPGAIEVTPADPTVASVTPGTGPDFGGTLLTLAGSGFTAGARVVVGPNIYVDGEPGGCTVVDANTITLTTASKPIGTFDVVVIGVTGVEGRRVNGFTTSGNIPVLDTVFPLAGAAAGGTQLKLRGQNFVAGGGFRVEIDGVIQTNVTVDDPTMVTVVTNGGVAGGPYDIDVYNPTGDFATRSYTYVATADPTLATVAPGSGTMLGGETIQVTGTNFVPGMQVEFGADETTGLGGSPAASMTFIDANTLDVLTPAITAGAKNVLVTNPGTGQAEVALAAFTFFGGGGGGGGGGCSVGGVPTPRDPWLPLTGGGWLFATILLVWLNAHRLRRRALRLARA